MDRDARRPLELLPFSDKVTCMREPVRTGDSGEEGPILASDAETALPSGLALEVEAQPHVVVEQGRPIIPVVTVTSSASEPGDGGK